MKKMFVWIAAAACVAGVPRAEAEEGAVPTGFAYQGVLSDPVSGPLTGEQTVTFRLFEAATGEDSPLWETNQVVACSPEGLFHAWLEGGDRMVEAFLRGGNGPFERYLELEVAGHGGAIAPRVEFTAGPRALLARSARQATGNFTVAGDLEVMSQDGAMQSPAAARFEGGASIANLVVEGNAEWSSNAAPLEVTGTLTAGKFVGLGFALSGCIAMWADTNAIPEGWVLCDGTHGTPDLRDRFVVGVQSTPSTSTYSCVYTDFDNNTVTNTYTYVDSYTNGATGGEAFVALEASHLPPHTHAYALARAEGTIRSGTPFSTDFFGDGDSVQCDSDSAGDGAPHENRPPYHALCFIMKL